MSVAASTFKAATHGSLEQEHGSTTLIATQPRLVPESSDNNSNIAQTAILSRKASRLDSNKDLNILMSKLMSNITSNEQKGTVQNIDSSSDKEFGLSNILLQEYGVLDNLIADNNHRTKFIDLLKVRMTNLQKYAENNENTKDISKKKLNTEINNLSTAFAEFQNDHNKAHSFFAAMRSYENLLGIVGFETKMTILMLQNAGVNEVTDMPIGLTEIEKTTDGITEILTKIQSFQEKYINSKHDKYVDNYIESELATADLNYVFTKTTIDLNKTSNILDTFIDKEPDLVAELICSHHNQYMAMNINLAEKLQNKKTSSNKSIKLLTQEQLSESKKIRAFLTSISKEERNHLEKNLIADKQKIYLAMSNKILEQNIDEHRDFAQSKLFFICSQAIHILKNNSTEDSKELLDTFVNKKHEIEAKILKNFIDQQQELPVWNKDKKYKDGFKDRCFLIKDLSIENIMKYLNSNEEADLYIKQLLKNTINYVNTLSLYKKTTTFEKNTNLNSKISAKDDDIISKRLHIVRFDMLKSQQKYLEDEAKKMIQNPEYHCEAVGAKNFNECLSYITMAYNIRDKMKARFRIADSISSLFTTVSMDYEPTITKTLTSLVNQMTRKVTNYSFSSCLTSDFTSDGPDSILKLEAKQKELENKTPFTLKEFFSLKLTTYIRESFHYSVLYFKDLMKLNPYVGKKISKRLYNLLPFVLTMSTKDSTAEIILKELRKKLNNEKFLNDMFIKDDKPEFDDKLFKDPEVARASRKMLFANDLLAVSKYGLDSLCVLHMYLPANTFNKLLDNALLEITKKESVTLTLELVWYIGDCIKKNETIAFLPGESLLKQIKYRFVTSFINAFERISVSIKDFRNGIEGSGKRLLFEVFAIFKVLAISALMSAAFVLPLIFVFQFAIQVVIPIAVVLSFNMLLATAKYEYGISENKFSFGSVFRNIYSKYDTSIGNYNDIKTRKQFNAEYDMLNRYNNGETPIDKDSKVREKEIQTDDELHKQDAVSYV